MARYTLDRSPVTLVADQIGAKQAATPEGFLLCEGVKIARTGPMLYLPEEVPEIEPGTNGAMVTILRDADVLFAPETVASFVGKPVTNDHPDDLVGPDTWRACAGGVVLNVRRGEGADSEHLVADLLITDAACIADVQAGKREVSCGYDTEAETVSPGLGRVTKIVGNHVALVDRGRCGPSCAIEDGAPAMAKAKRSVWDRLATAFKANDEEAFKEELEAAKDEAGGEGQHIHVHLGQQEPGEADPVKTDEADPAEERFSRIEASLATIAEAVAKLQKPEAPAKDEDPDPEEEKPSEVKDEDPEEKEEPEKKPTMDAAAVSEQFRDVLSRAEILAPGIALPKFDAKAPKLMVDAMCALRAKALQQAYDTAATRPHVEAVAGLKPDFKKMKCDHAAVVFRGASELIKAANSRGKDAPAQNLPTGGKMNAAAYAEMIAARRGK